MIGILGISMDPQHGEGGAAAFQRLQKCIVDQTEDESVFAWYSDEYEESGLLAPSLECFKDCQYFEVSPDTRSLGKRFESDGRGILVKIPVPHIPHKEKRLEIVLRCEDTMARYRKASHIRISLIHSQTSSFALGWRVNCGTLAHAKLPSMGGTKVRSFYGSLPHIYVNYDKKVTRKQQSK